MVQTTLIDGKTLTNSQVGKIVISVLRRLESPEKIKTEVQEGKFNDETKACRTSVYAIKFIQHALVSQKKVKKDKPRKPGEFGKIKMS